MCRNVLNILIQRKQVILRKITYFMSLSAIHSASNMCIFLRTLALNLCKTLYAKVCLLYYFTKVAKKSWIPVMSAPPLAHLSSIF